MDCLPKTWLLHDIPGHHQTHWSVCCANWCCTQWCWILCHTCRIWVSIYTNGSLVIHRLHALGVLICVRLDNVMFTLTNTSLFINLWGLLLAVDDDLLCHLSFQPDSPLITWLQKTGTNYFEIRSKLKGDDSVCHFTRVDIREEKYKLRKNLPVGDFPHHIFHLRPPLVLQNLLPFTISVGSIVSYQKWKRFIVTQQPKSSTVL